MPVPHKKKTQNRIPLKKPALLKGWCWKSKACLVAPPPYHPFGTPPDAKAELPDTVMPLLVLPLDLAIPGNRLTRQTEPDTPEVWTGDFGPTYPP